jgi:hypothetical protein
MCEVDDADAIDAADEPVAEPLRDAFSSFNSLFKKQIKIFGKRQV